MFDFTGRVVMVTGASGNLGSAVARNFHANSARLALIDRHKDILQKVFPDLIGALAPDISWSPGATPRGAMI